MVATQRTVPLLIIYLPPPLGRGWEAHQGFLSRVGLEIKLQLARCVSEHLSSHPSAQSVDNPQPSDRDEYGSRGRAAQCSEAEGESDLLAPLQV